MYKRDDSEAVTIQWLSGLIRDDYVAKIMH
jgi:hypothetical protein